ncbi:MAG: rhomboid family intramembrane serine protease [Leptospiraceae bacterium]|nr:rhomboid family intramembrane serine protease [Leptospiraceae bacterium]
MSYTGNSYGYQVRFGPPASPTVKLLIIFNVVVFLIQSFLHLFQSAVMESVFALTPELVSRGYIWQLLTYSFLHGDFFHILFNMLTLWMFGSELEVLWGSMRFLQFYLFSCLTGGVLTYLVDNFTSYDQGTVLGASAGIYGLLIAYAIIWPNREVLFMMFFPIKIKYMVAILMLMLAFSQGKNIAHIAHLGGVLGGLIFLYFIKKINTTSNFQFSLKDYFHKRKMKRLQEEINKRVNAKERVDELLEKISKQGMKSLSRKEKQFLNEASNKYYNE